MKSPHSLGVDGGPQIGDGAFSGVQQMVEDITSTGTAAGDFAEPLPHSSKVPMFNKL